MLRGVLKVRRTQKMQTPLDTWGSTTQTKALRKKHFWLDNDHSSKNLTSEDFQSRENICIITTRKNVGKHFQTGITPKREFVCRNNGLDRGRLDWR
jgi:hypothetical protein